MARTTSVWVMFVTCCVYGALISAAPAEEKAEHKAMTFAELPEKVQAAVKAYGGEVEEVEMESEDGKIEYGVEIEKDGKEIELSLDAEGNVLETETEISLSEAPAAVREVLEKFAQVGEIEEIVKEEEHGKIAYTAEIEIGEAEFELKLDPDGKILEVEKSDDELRVSAAD